MAAKVTICDLDPEVKSLVKKFRLRKEKTNAAIVLKIDTSRLMVILDEQYENMTSDELQEELPEHQPRYVLYSYCLHHDDGRISYPLCLVLICPQGTKPELAMMYGGSCIELQNLMGLSKRSELRELEEFTEEWLKKELEFC